MVESVMREITIPGGFDTNYSQECFSSNGPYYLPSPVQLVMVVEVCRNSRK
ncbi:MAG: hypothetical protein IPL67_19485 [Ignavibacteria bacterium]|nr:hypothetical protein [Ignavibacteria bacterium]